MIIYDYIKMFNLNVWSSFEDDDRQMDRWIDINMLLKCIYLFLNIMNC